MQAKPGESCGEAVTELRVCAYSMNNNRDEVLTISGSISHDCGLRISEDQEGATAVIGGSATRSGFLLAVSPVSTRSWASHDGHPRSLPPPTSELRGMGHGATPGLSGIQASVATRGLQGQAGAARQVGERPGMQSCSSAARWSGAEDCSSAESASTAWIFRRGPAPEPGGGASGGFNGTRDLWWVLGAADAVSRQVTEIRRRGCELHREDSRLIQRNIVMIWKLGIDCSLIVELSTLLWRVEFDCGIL